ncbi:MAG: hypothetical protein Q9195_006782 [Heterodermia aff. obscurata]
MADSKSQAFRAEDVFTGEIFCSMGIIVVILLPICAWRMTLSYPSLDNRAIARLKNHTSHFIFPKDPPGYGVLVYLDVAHILGTERIYVVAIAVIHAWAFEGWNHVVPSRSTRFTKASCGIEIAWRSIAYARQRDQLRMQHLILGLLHLIDQMTKRHAFCASTSSILMHKQPLGHIELLPSQTLSGSNASAPRLPIHNTSLKVFAQAQNPTAQRQIVDPADPDFAIRYGRRGDGLSLVDFLSTVLYAMATAAQASNTERCGDLAGFNPKRSAVYRISGRRTTDWSHPLTYELVRRGLGLLSVAIYEEAASGEVWFQFLYRGDVVGSGNIDLSDFAGSTAR